MNFMSTHPAFAFIFAIIFISMIVAGHMKMQDLNRRIRHNHDKQ